MSHKKAYNDITVPELKEEVQKRGISPKNMKKAELYGLYAEGFM